MNSINESIKKMVVGLENLNNKLKMKINRKTSSILQRIEELKNQKN